MKSLSSSLTQNLEWLDHSFCGTADLYTKRLKLGKIDCALCMFDGLSGMEKVCQLLLWRAGEKNTFLMDGEDVFRLLFSQSDLPLENSPITETQDMITRLTAGMAVLLIDGCPRALAVGSQSMSFRAVGEPTGERNIKGSQEGFTDLLRVNISLLRRLIRTTDFCVEYGQAGERTQTEYALCFDKKRVPEKLLEQTKQQLKELKLPFLFDSAYLTPFLRLERFHLFGGIGYTERPAAACAKLCEGKIVILVNGSPFALILPYFFSENFESLDDYSTTALFASFIRTVKYVGFTLAILLPGLYVMAVSYCPEVLPYQLLSIVAKGEADTPFPIMLEMLLVLTVLEIIREAGLRMPKQLGHSVSLVAALVLGNTAVESGIMSTPVIIAAAIAAISMYLIPSLYEQTTLLRFLFVVLCGCFGMMGLAAGLFGVFALICRESQGYPYTFPLVPLNRSVYRDGVVRLSWNQLARAPYSLSQTPKQEGGSDAG